MPLRWLAIVALAAGCKAPEAARPAPAGEARALPADLAPAVHEAERLGRAIFDQDLASGRAFDALSAALGSEPDPRIRGSISRRRGEHWRVQFFGGEDAPSALWEADVGVFGAGVSLEALSPPVPLDPEGAAMARSRVTASAQPFAPCSSRYDTVVLPASLIDRKGYLVYLLAVTKARGEWIVGGHQRFLIAEDGVTVQNHRPLSRGCLAVPASRRPSGGHGAWVTHVVSDAPAETHVFLSLQHQSPLFVGTRRGVWKVAGEKISFRGG